MNFDPYVDYRAAAEPVTTLVTDQSTLHVCEAVGGSGMNIADWVNTFQWCDAMLCSRVGPQRVQLCETFESEFAGCQ